MKLFNSASNMQGAIEDNNLATLKKYLDTPKKAKKWLNATDRGWLPIKWAAEKNQLDALRMMFEAGAAQFVTQENDLFPIETAIIKNHSDILVFLLEKGASITTAMTTASQQKKINAVETIIQYAAQKFEEDEKPILTDLLQIAAQNQFTEAVEKLVLYGIPRDTVLAQSQRLLHYAVALNNRALAGNVLKDGHLDSQDMNKNTPLHLAIINKHPEMVHLLLEAGARTDLKNADGYTAEMLARTTDLEIAMLFEEKMKLEPAPAADAQNWQPMGDDSVVFTAHYPLQNLKIREVFNFAQKIQRVTTLDLETKTESSTATPFADIAPAALEKAFAAYTNAGGKMTQQDALGLPHIVKLGS